MAFENPPLDDVRALLTSARTIAVVGLSPDPDRPSYSVATYLQENGYRIVPVRPGGGQLLGEAVFARLSDVPFPIDVVDIFRASRFASAHVDEAIAIKARAVWLQEGVLDQAAALRARAAGLLTSMDCCLLKAHRKAGLSNSRPPPRR